MKTAPKLLLGAAAGLAAYTAAEAWRNSRIPTIPANTPRAFQIHLHSILQNLEDGTPFDETLLDDSFLFIEKRYDCSDFLANTLLRYLYAYADRLSDGLRERVEETLLGFKYYMDQPGEDSMCYWSENHQILYAGLEYLAGHYFAGRVFKNSGQKGGYHRERGRRRVLQWCRRRLLYGFTEWYSNNYYLEDIAAMSNILEFAPDADVRAAMTDTMHIILFDMATQSFKGSFVSTGGRMYENNKKTGKYGSQLNRVIAKAFDMEVEDCAWPLNEELTLMTADMDLNFLLNKAYHTPPVLKRIAQDPQRRVIKASSSLDIDEALESGLFGRSDEQLAAQWEMEAWTNHQVLANSMGGLRRYQMFSSEFFAPLKALDLTVLRPFYGALSKALKPITDGKATQRANTYTFRTPYYMLATAQKYLPGGFSDQQHIWSLILSDEVCVFTTHPSGELEEKGALSKSPGYWTGNARNPHACQHENVMLAIYRIPARKTTFEHSLAPFTHAYFPQRRFDECLLDEGIAFGRLGGAFVALLSLTPFVVAGDEELKQYGKTQAWVCECSDETAESFEGFVRRVRETALSAEGAVLRYGARYSLAFGGGFYVDGRAVDTQYARYDSDYCKAPRASGGFTYRFGGDSLTIPGR